MTSDFILETSSLEDIYTSSSVSSQAIRWGNLINCFNKTFHTQSPDFIARAPGRVNVIGEHIDYCGFSVLPAAIEPDLLIAASASYPSDSTEDVNQRVGFNGQPASVEVVNLNLNYPGEKFTYDHNGHISLGKVGLWTDYIKSAISTAINHLREDPSKGFKIPESVKLLVDGTVPPGSGLSSSAALATASVLVALRIHQTKAEVVPKYLAASLAISTERACGISVGGMDQTASVFGQPAKLLHIEFHPATQVVPFSVPKQGRINFVIANSFVTSNKIDSAKRQYNLRVVECRLAARLLSKALLPNDSELSINTLREFVDHYSSSLGNDENNSKTILKSIQLILERFEEFLGMHDSLTIEGAIKILGIDGQTFKDEILNGLEVEPKDGKFKIFSRARHVFTEAKRVYDFRNLLEQATENDKDDEENFEFINRMGELMNESHFSCQVDYDCSCEELEEIISIARANGSLGSRLTGAGWGGSTVHLVRDEDTTRLIDSIKEQYYHKRFNINGIGANDSDKKYDLDQACFSTKPQGGACVFKMV
ncbi:N-acetylgalactosamine kinase [Phakopsora pachyrhizi]|uniref:Galactokinase n=1 Tax=Phakopsora pachyrhizi TaxID=170000 RepID=A0AAV0B4Z2_PHAPC|nr:N-acetylgalactosamine kinase [Phakopsora pachyrhizi]CAH7677081.1 N-acetylgalactosamine kinase [Phakopsora pachyrhizi]